MFGISISGIKGAQKHLDVTSNNIANANSYGFKKSRAEFADVYANSIFSNNRTNAGMGTQNTIVAQQFVQGSLSGDTGNSLDMAIQGNGFFVLSNENGLGSSAHTYTRNGAFQVDKEGYIITATGDYLQGWDVNEDGSATSIDLNGTHSIQLPQDTGAPNASNEIGIGVNLPADKDPVSSPTGPIATDPVTGAQVNPQLDEKYQSQGYYRNPTTGAIITDTQNYPPANGIKAYSSKFDPKDPSTYTSSTSQTIHDSLGRAHTLTYYMLKQGPESDDSNNTVWTVIPFLDGQPVDIAKTGTGTAPEDNPVMISVDKGNSSVAGANFFGFQVTFDSTGQAIPDKQIPRALHLTNPNTNEGDVQGAPVSTSLRHDLFGYPGDPADDGLLGVADPTFEEWGNPPIVKDPAFDNGDGTLRGAMGIGIDPFQDVHITFEATQYGSSKFGVTKAPWNDGYSTGVLLGINVDENGVIQCEYSNGRLVNIAKVAMADFTNTQGLTKVGDTQWKESLYSGDAIPKEANSGGAGSIKGSNLELSNVDLTSELVELITAQRNYQANSQSLQTQNTVMDSILNIR